MQHLERERERDRKRTETEQGKWDKYTTVEGGGSAERSQFLRHGHTVTGLTPV